MYQPDTVDSDMGERPMKKSSIRKPLLVKKDQDTEDSNEPTYDCSNVADPFLSTKASESRNTISRAYETASSKDEEKIPICVSVDVSKLPEGHDIYYVPFRFGLAVTSNQEKINVTLPIHDVPQNVALLSPDDVELLKNAIDVRIAQADERQERKEQRRFDRINRIMQCGSSARDTPVQPETNPAPTHVRARCHASPSDAETMLTPGMEQQRLPEDAESPECLHWNAMYEDWSWIVNSVGSLVNNGLFSTRCSVWTGKS